MHANTWHSICSYYAPMTVNYYYSMSFRYLSYKIGSVVLHRVVLTIKQTYVYTLLSTELSKNQMIAAVSMSGSVYNKLLKMDVL